MSRFTFIPLLFLLILLVNADTVTGATDYPGDKPAATDTAPSETTTPPETTTADTTTPETVTPDTTPSETTTPAAEETIPDSITSATDYPETAPTEETAGIPESRPVEETKSIRETRPVEEQFTGPDPEKEAPLSPEHGQEEVALDADSGKLEETKIAEDEPEVKKEEETALVEEKREEEPEQITEKTDEVTKATDYPRKEDYFKVTFSPPRLDPGEKEELKDYQLDEDIQMDDLIPDTYAIHKLEDFVVEKRKEAAGDVDTMIIFESPSDNMVPPSDRFEYLERGEQVLRTDFELDDFTPQTIEDFIAVQPDFKYDTANTILPGINRINEIVGEGAFTMAFGDFKRNRLNSSLSLLRKLIHYNYRVKEAYYYLALCLFQKKQYYLSISHLIKSAEYSAEEDTEELFKNYDAIGNIYSHIGEYNKAIIYYNKALRFSPEQQDIYNKLGFMYYYLKSYSNALKYWFKAGEEGNLESKKNYEWLKDMLKKKDN